MQLLRGIRLCDLDSLNYVWETMRALYERAQGLIIAVK